MANGNSSKRTVQMANAGIPSGKPGAPTPDFKPSMKKLWRVFIKDFPYAAQFKRPVGRAAMDQFLDDFFHARGWKKNPDPVFVNSNTGERKASSEITGVLVDELADA